MKADDEHMMELPHHLVKQAYCKSNMHGIARKKFSLALFASRTNHSYYMSESQTRAHVNFVKCMTREDRQ